MQDNNVLCINVSFDDAMTRAAEPIEGGGFSGPASLGVSLYKAADKSTAYSAGSTNVEYLTTDGSKWKSSTPVYLGSSEAVVTAYYPFSSDVSDITAVAMKTDDPKDWMYQPLGTETCSASASQADIALQHAQAIVKVIINKSSANPYIGAGEISKITISSPSFSTEGLLNSTTGEITGTASSITENTWNKQVKASGNSEAQDQWFVSPIAETENAKVTIMITIDGVNYMINNVPMMSSGSAAPIVRGNTYTFPLTLSSTSLTMENVSITGWSEVGSLSGELEVYNPHSSAIIDVTRFRNSISETDLSKISKISFVYGSGTKSSRKISTDDSPYEIYCSVKYSDYSITVSTPAYSILATNLSGMFSGFSSLASLDMSGFDTHNVTSMSKMFYDCSSLTSLDMSGFDTHNVTSMSNMFYHCSSLTSLDLSSFDTNNVTTMENMFSRCSGLTSLDMSGFDTHNVTSMSRMFYNCSRLTSLDLSSFDTQNVTEMYHMFSGCSSLTSLDMSGFDTQNVTDMCYMFNNCSSLTSLDLSSFDTQNVTDMRYMFYSCRSLTSLDLSSFNTEKVTNMRQMFWTCASLTSLDLSNFNTEKVTSMIEMFSGCNSLTSLNLSSFNTEKVTRMEYMFYCCYALTSLDLSGFNMSSVEDIGHIHMILWTADSSKYCEITCTEATKTKILSGMDVTNSYIIWK